MPSATSSPGRRSRPRAADAVAGPASGGEVRDRATLRYLEELHRRIEELAAGSRWPEVEALMRERNALLQDFRDAERAAALRAAQRSTDRILRLAASARLELAGELRKLQQGRKATEAYRAHGARSVAGR